MRLSITTVDAFADQPFAGNPAAVCVLNESQTGLDDETLQAIAMEMNLSETAYVRRVPDGFNLRWFTPAVEVELCGHATLASAHVLWEAEHVPRETPIHFHTRSGLLEAHERNGLIELDFPKSDLHATSPPAGLEAALGAAAEHTCKTQFDYLLELKDETIVRALTPDHRALRYLDVRGVIVTARSDSKEFDFVSRFFAPGSGVDEDPVTGSAHCALAPYWSEKLGKTELVGYQASQRGGTVRVRVEGDRCVLGGTAFSVLHGELNLPDPSHLTMRTNS